MVLNQPAGEPVALAPTHAGNPAGELAANLTIVPWTPGAAVSEQGTSSTERYHLHPAANMPLWMPDVQCCPPLIEEQPLLVRSASCSGVSKSRHIPMLPIGGMSSTCSAESQQTEPVLAWQSSVEVPEMRMAHSSLLPFEDSLEGFAGQPWIVVIVCGSGCMAVGDEVQIAAGDVWACFGNVMLAKRQQQIVLCRHAPYSQMMNIQCACNGWEIAVSDFRCSPEGWCVPIDREQACMNALAGFLQFMLAAGSQLLAQLGITGCATGIESSSLPSWQTSCLQTNTWVTQSGAKMWDVVLSGKNDFSPSWASGNHLLDTVPKNKNSSATRLTPVGCDDEANVHSETLALEDVEPDMESEMIENPGWVARAKLPIESHPQMEVMPLIQLPESLVIEMPFHHEILLESLGSSTGTSAQLALEDGQPDVESDETKAASSVEVERCSKDVCKPVSVPAKPIQKKPKRPAVRQGRRDKASRTKCQSFRMDAGEADVGRQRESSLARGYDALEADWRPPGKDTDAVRTRATCDYSLSRSCDASDDLKAPKELPPVRCTTPMQTTSRFSARHRAAMAAASAMAWEVGSRETKVPELRSDTPVVNRPAPEVRLSRSPSRVQSYMPTSSAMAFDLEGHIACSTSTSSQAAPSRALPLLTPFGISASKLPPVPMQRKSQNIAAWRVPVHRNPVVKRLASDHDF